MKKQIPRGDEGMICPFHHQSMASVCHLCPLWQLIRGKHPQTGEDIDAWNCALAHLPMLLINSANETRMGVAATQQVANVMLRASEAVRLERLASKTGYKEIG